LEMKKRNDDSGNIEARERGFLETGEAFYTNRYTTKASIDAITREDLVAFHRRYVAPKNFSLAVAGDFDRATMLKKLDALFASWPVAGAEAAPSVPKPEHKITKGVFLVDKDVNQGRVSVILPGLLWSDPDFFPANVMTDILGAGGFTSRITNRVRSDEGLAYDARANFRGGNWYRGTLVAAFQSKVRTCSYATQIVFEEMQKMKAFGADPKTSASDEDELKTSKNSFIETLPRRFQTKAQAMGVLLEEELIGRYQLFPNYYGSYRANMEKVTAADVKKAADKLLATGSAAVLVVGKKDDLLNPDPKHPVKFEDLGLGKVVELPLRDPLTMKPISQGAGK
ncbi:MAG TPA: insulinase family protein, partial [Thermoanaerobaculia bacterium]|nr:insulinase family protein [Thermoanaerobaculia bacterium]